MEVLISCSLPKYYNSVENTVLLLLNHIPYTERKVKRYFCIQDPVSHPVMKSSTTNTISEFIDYKKILWRLCNLLTPLEKEEIVINSLKGEPSMWKRSNEELKPQEIKI